ncbi:transposase InsO family protein, partial [Peribacillus huizhouensis]|nr:transposase InsO family protein [Peribacillus huizhouensis]
MSPKGNCYNNSVMEIFFGIMKSEFLNFEEFEGLEHFKLELEKYIKYYNNQRIKAKLKHTKLSSTNQDNGLYYYFFIVEVKKRSIMPW